MQEQNAASRGVLHSVCHFRYRNDAFRVLTESLVPQGCNQRVFLEQGTQRH